MDIERAIMAADIERRQLEELSRQFVRSWQAVRTWDQHIDDDTDYGAEDVYGDGVEE
jgi:hypothetical protein